MMEGWKEYKLGSLFHIKHGWAFKGEYFSDSGNLIVVTPGNFIEEGGFRQRDGKEKYYTDKFPKEYLLSKGDLIIAMTEQGEGLLGSPALITENNKFLHNQRIGLFQNIDGELICKNYLYYLFFTRYIRGLIAGSSTGTKVKHTAPKRIYSIKINLPPLPTQNKIANILSAYDNLIENNQKRIKLMEEMAQKMYEEWFVRMKFPGHGTAMFNKEKGLPEGWEKKSITNFKSFKQDKSKLKSFLKTKKYYATADIEGTKITSNGETITWKNRPSRAQIKPNNNTVWFARMSNTFKVLCFNNKNIDLQNNSILSSGFAGFKALNDLSLPFLYFTINSTFFHELKNIYATGATQVSLNNESMKFIKILEPTIEVVENYGKNTLPLIEEISVLLRQNQLLKEARDILLPRLMTGIIDVEKIKK